MEKLKQYVVFTVVGCLGILAAGWVLLVSPKRADAADLRAQAAEQVSANAQLETQLQVLKAQAKDLPKQQAKLAAVAAKIPDNPALPRLIRALTTAASAAGVELVSVTPSTPALVTAARTTTPTSPAAAGAAATAAAPAAPAAPAPAAGAPASAAAGAASSAGQLASVPLTLNVAGGYFQIEQVLANLENLQRSMRVNNVTLIPGDNPLKPRTGSTADGRGLTATIVGQVFMATGRPPAAAVSVPGQTTAAPAGGLTPTVSAPVAPAKK
jgi:Tfp pilus assembly protein PilO